MPFGHCCVNLCEDMHEYQDIGNSFKNLFSLLNRNIFFFAKSAKNPIKYLLFSINNQPQHFIVKKLAIFRNIFIVTCRMISEQS